MSIASRIENMYGNVDKAYKSVENLGIDLTNVDKNLENLSTKINDLYEVFPKVESEETTSAITLSPTQKAKMSLTLKGNIEQDGEPTPTTPVDIHIVSGDNEIKVCNSNIFDGEMELGSINSSGTKITNDTLIRTKNYTPVEENADYILSTTLSASGYTRNFIWFYDENYNKIGNSTKANGNYFTTVEGTKYILFRPDYATTDTTLKFWLNKGQTALPYQEHKEYTKEINLPIENLFNINNGSNYNVDNGSISIVDNKVRATNLNVGSGHRGGMYLGGNELFGKTITLSAKWDASHSDVGKLNIVTSNNNGGDRTILGVLETNGGSLTLTLPNSYTTGTQFTLVFYTNNSSQSAGVYVDYFDIQAEIGSKKNSYSPYGTTPIEVGGIGEYEDEFFKNTTDSEYYDSTLLKDKWYLKKRIGKYNVNTSQIVLESYSNLEYAKIPKPSDYVGYKAYGNNPIYYSHALFSINSGSWNKIANIGNIYSGAEKYVFYLGFEKGTDLETIQSELVGSYLYYPLSTPENILLNNTLQETLDSFYSMQEQTNISQGNNDLPFIIKASALKDFTTLE